VIGSIGVIIFCCVILFVFGLVDLTLREAGILPTYTPEPTSTGTPSPSCTPTSTVTPSPTGTPIPTQTPLPTSTNTPIPTMSPSVRLETEIVEALGPSRDDRPKLQGFQFDQETGSIIVEWLIQGRPGSGVEQDWAFEDSEKILIVIGESSIEFSTIELIGLADVTDERGNTETIEVLRLRFSDQALADVNWEYFEPWHRPAPLHNWADYKQSHPDYQWW
jgi:hypothetical protein